ncbi:MAG: T9SS type A sorting domain-containing protein, partial [Candidatus Zophobacter franzmannii]|nr:T9SS type A sorting domain-containing protein [Candidatus Zophobacter franzmannii]
IYVLDYQGTPLAGFPKPVDYGAGIAPAIADLDQNGSNDFIIGGSTGMLYAYNYEGNVLAGFPVDLGAPINSSPTILDDNSIAVATGSQLFRVSATGTIEASMDIPNSIANSVIATDFLPNVEGLEIGFVTSNGAIYIVTNNLEVVSGFPIDSGMLHAWPPLAGDIDSNGTKELITISQTNNIVISQRDGSPFIGFPYNLCYNGHQAAQLSDLDSDGDLDIVCGVDLGIMVVDTKRPYNGYLDWMIFRGDLARTGNYNLINYVENDEDLQIPIVTKLDGNYPNPFNPTTTINFALAKAQKVSLSVYNIKGQKVKTLINESRGVGKHSVIWDGLDENDKSVSSGVYLYRLKTGGRNYTEKMSLIK